MQNDDIFESTVTKAHKMAQQAGEVFESKSLYNDVANVASMPELKKEEKLMPERQTESIPQATNAIPVFIDAVEALPEPVKPVQPDKLDRMYATLQKGLTDIGVEVDRNREIMKQAQDQMNQVQRNLTALLAQKSLVEQLIANLNEQ